jgi:hypothetical protein
LNAEEEDSSPLNTELEEEVAGFGLTTNGLLTPPPPPGWGQRMNTEGDFAFIDLCCSRGCAGKLNMQQTDWE